MRSSNPVLSDRLFGRETASPSTGVMTIYGTIQKSFVLLMLVVAAAALAWTQFANANFSNVGVVMVVGGILGFVLALVTIFKKPWAPVTAPLYAVCQGAFLGGLSGLLEYQYPGIVIQAVGLTFGTLFCLLGAYRSGLISVTDKFRMGLMSAMGGLMLFYLANFILGFMGINLTIIHGNGVFSIGLSAVVVVIAALNLVLDFDFIERASHENLPKYMEWFASFGLMVTLIWLYVEILNLLSKLNSRKD